MSVQTKEIRWNTMSLSVLYGHTPGSIYLFIIKSNTTKYCSCSLVPGVLFPPTRLGAKCHDVTECDFSRYAFRWRHEISHQGEGAGRERLRTRLLFMTAFVGIDTVKDAHKQLARRSIHRFETWKKKADISGAFPDIFWQYAQSQ